MHDMSISSWVSAIHCAAVSTVTPVSKSALTSRPVRASYFELAVKRTLDIFGASTTLLLLSPFLLFVAIAIKLDSRGPVFFSQQRWGKDCRVIRVLKFRTMYAEMGDPSGVKQAIANDPRITRLGAVLRRWNIDELPQLFNVLRGDMSLVGPRCHPIGMLAAGMPYEELVADYHVRHLVRPGITGLAQMHGLRGATVDSDKALKRFGYDARYVANVSLWLDLRIIWGTLRREAFRGAKY
jgi:polysaccharide biosynthesis protein PslA